MKQRFHFRVKNTITRVFGKNSQNLETTNKKSVNRKAGSGVVDLSQEPDSDSDLSAPEDFPPARKADKRLLYEQHSNFLHGEKSVYSDELSKSEIPDENYLLDIEKSVYSDEICKSQIPDENDDGYFNRNLVHCNASESGNINTGFVKIGGVEDDEQKPNCYSLSGQGIDPPPRQPECTRQSIDKRLQYYDSDYESDRDNVDGESLDDTENELDIKSESEFSQSDVDEEDADETEMFDEIGAGEGVHENDSGYLSERTGSGVSGIQQSFGSSFCLPEIDADDVEFDGCGFPYLERNVPKRGDFELFLLLSGIERIPPNRVSVAFYGKRVDRLFTNNLSDF